MPKCYSFAPSNVRLISHPLSWASTDTVPRPSKVCNDVKTTWLRFTSCNALSTVPILLYPLIALFSRAPHTQNDNTLVELNRSHSRVVGSRQLDHVPIYQQKSPLLFITLNSVTRSRIFHSANYTFAPLVCYFYKGAHCHKRRGERNACYPERKKLLCQSFDVLF